MCTDTDKSGLVQAHVFLYGRAEYLVIGCNFVNSFSIFSSRLNSWSRSIPYVEESNSVVASALLSVQEGPSGMVT